MNRRDRTFFTILKCIGFIIMLIFALWWFNPARLSHNFDGVAHGIDVILFVSLSYVVWHGIFSQLFVWLVAGKIRNPFYYEPEPGLRVAFITTFVPASEPISLLHNILPAMVSADYPHDTWLLDEGDDATAKTVCKQYGVHYFSRKGIERYNTPDGTFAAKTKGGNHNAWYDAVGIHYDIVAQIDTDFVPKHHFLTRTLGFFRISSVGFVGTPQVYGNLSDSVVARGAAQQTYSFYGTILRGLHGMGMTLMIGANHVVRVSALKDIGLYRAHLTEDLLTGMSMHSNKWQSIYVPEVLAVGEGPSTWPAYFNQQMRWAFGCIDILFRHTPKLIRRMEGKHAWYYLLLQQHYFTGLAMALGVMLLTVYAILGLTPASMTLNMVLTLYVPLVLWQWLVAMWLQQYFVDPETESGLHWSGGLISVAAWPIYFMALVGVLRGKRLSFKVTPKGENQVNYTPASLFIPHITIGTLTAGDVAVGYATGHDSPAMLIWAVLTALFMYGLVLSVLAPQWIHKLRFKHA
jgi:cellulose synthase/poly-beta-1,6-N-acetylglucosamine synthase-like glycosyltransferase